MGGNVKFSLRNAQNGEKKLNFAIGNPRDSHQFGENEQE